MLRRAFLIDDDAVFRYGLAWALKEYCGIVSVAAESFDEEARPTLAKCEFDLLMMGPPYQPYADDAWMIDALSVPRKFFVVLLHGGEPKSAVNRFESIGFDAVLSKPVTLGGLQRMIKSLRQLESNALPGTSHRTLSEALKNESPTASRCLPYLTEREHEILRRTADGHSCATISRDLGISIKTAERYRRSLFRKLELDNVAALTKLAVREGLSSL